MVVAVMDVGIMRMLVRQDRVAVPMRMRLVGRHAVMGMIVLMMLVVNMLVLMLVGAMRVTVFVPLDEMQPKSQAHQTSRREQLNRDRLRQDDYRYDGADERCEREIGTRSRGPQVAQRQNEHGEARAISEKAYQAHT